MCISNVLCCHQRVLMIVSLLLSAHHQMSLIPTETERATPQ